MRLPGWWMVLVGAGCMEPTLVSRPSSPDEPDEPGDSDGGVESNIPPGTPLGGVRGLLCEGVNRPLVGAFVQVEHAFGVARTSTDAEGRFTLDDVPAGPHTVVITGTNQQEVYPVDIPAESFAEVQGERCEDPCEFAAPCVGLGEAMDRGWAAITLGNYGDVRIENLSAANGICLDPWMAVFSEESQDALVGVEPGLKINPGQTHTFSYGVDVFGGDGREAWWCIEREQVTAAGAEYQYNGSLAPYMLERWIEDRTDEDWDSVEDHEDYDEESQLQAQRNIWRDEMEQPIVLVGRKNSVVRLYNEASRQEVVVQAKNLGQKPAVAEVYERVPTGFAVYYTTPAAQIQPQSDGSTLLIWQVDLAAAAASTGSQTRYDMAELRYVVGRGDTTCRGRCEGFGAWSSWVDRYRSRWRSDSEPLILEVCREK